MSQNPFCEKLPSYSLRMDGGRGWGGGQKGNVFANKQKKKREKENKYLLLAR